MARKLWHRDLSILVAEELFLQETSTISLKRNVETFNPRCWGTLFARKQWKRVDNVVKRSFNPRCWGTLFASDWAKIKYIPLQYLSILVAEELFLQASGAVAWSGYATQLSILVAEELFLQAISAYAEYMRMHGYFQSSLLRNSFCKLTVLIWILLRFPLSFNPRCWGTLFASKEPSTHALTYYELSILVAEELFLQGWDKWKILLARNTFQSSLLRNSFCKFLNPNTVLVHDNNFQSSLLRNSFCKSGDFTAVETATGYLSILVAEELFLQVIT